MALYQYYSFYFLSFPLRVTQPGGQHLSSVAGAEVSKLNMPP